MDFNTAFSLVTAGVAVIMDLRTAKVDNGWIVFSLCTGGLAQCMLHGAAGVLEFAAGAALPVFLLGILFVFRMLGPGDIKVFCALGGMLGPKAILQCMAGAVLCGAGIAAAILVFQGGLRFRLHYFFQYILDFCQTGQRKPYYRPGMSSYENFHFTVPVFMSVMLYAGGVY